MTKYFVNCKNLDELKKAYKAAAMKNHPDMGGDTATMQADQCRVRSPVRGPEAQPERAGRRGYHRPDPRHHRERRRLHRHHLRAAEAGRDHR